MRLAFNFKNSKRIVLTSDESKLFLKKVNYIKLLKTVTSKKSDLDGTFTVREKEVKTKDLSSVEMIL